MIRFKSLEGDDLIKREFCNRSKSFHFSQSPQKKQERRRTISHPNHKTHPHFFFCLAKYLGSTWCLKNAYSEEDSTCRLQRSSILMTCNATQVTKMIKSDNWQNLQRPYVFKKKNDSASLRQYKTENSPKVPTLKDMSVHSASLLQRYHCCAIYQGGNKELVQVKIHW